MMLPGRSIIVNTTDGDSVRGVSRMSWRWVKLRDAWGSISSTGPDVVGVLMFPPTAIVSVQILPREAKR